MAPHNLGTVVGFEFTRTIKKRRFWIATLAIPMALAVVFVLVYISNSSTGASASGQRNARFGFAYTDASGLIAPETAAALGGRKAADPATAIGDVKSGRTDAYFDYPANPGADPVLVYGTDRGIFENGKYDAVAKQLLAASAQQKIGSPALALAAGAHIRTQSETFKDGHASGGINAVIPPLLFLLVFYVSIILLSNQMLSSTLEEKENRVTEMILTTLDPTTLIIGKVISLLMVGLVQMLVFLAPVAAGYLFFRDRLALPAIDLTHLDFQPAPMITAALILLGGFTVFTATLVSIGAVMPTAKEAGVVFGPLMALIFVPFYTVSLIVSDPTAPIVQAFTYFPLTAPVTALLRNGFGTLTPGESALVIVELFTTGFLLLRLAVHLFRYGSIEYSRKLTLKEALTRRPTTATPTNHRAR